MSTQRYTPEFKEEAVRQVVERGYAVPEVAARLGVSAHSLYKWVKAVMPTKDEKQSAELVEAKSEILRLRSQMRRLEEERDLLKKPHGTLPGSPSKVPVHERTSAGVFACADVPGIESGPCWVLPMAAPTSLAASKGRCSVGRGDSSFLFGSGGVYGANRVFRDLREAGETCGRNRVARLMQVNKIKAVRGYKAPRRIAGRPSIIAPNRLNREFTVDAPDQAWVTDITYIRTWQGWLYLAVVVDLFARKVVGWSMKPTLSRELAIDALLMAVWRRKPKNSVLVHSDQGSQYGSDDWRRFCKANNLEPSMSRRGNCWDNAVAESFFSSLKKERIRKRIYKTRDLARADIFDYIEVFYNRTRRHSHLGGVSPEAFERALT